MWPKFGKYSVFMKELIIFINIWSRFYKDQTRKTNFSEGCSWFKFNNLVLALGMALKFYACVAKALKLKVRKFWGFLQGKNLFGPLPPSWIGLNTVWSNIFYLFVIYFLSIDSLCSVNIRHRSDISSLKIFCLLSTHKHAKYHD